MSQVNNWMDSYSKCPPRNTVRHAGTRSSQTVDLTSASMPQGDWWQRSEPEHHYEAWPDILVKEERIRYSDNLRPPRRSRRTTRDDEIFDGHSGGSYGKYMVISKPLLLACAKDQIRATTVGCGEVGVRRYRKQRPAQTTAHGKSKVISR